MNLLRRAEKLALLSSIVQGNMTPGQVAQFRQSREPMQLTLSLGDGEDSLPYDPDEPTYHIDIYSDHTTECYYRYPDGRIEYANR